MRRYSLFWSFGFEISVRGFDEKIFHLLDAILTRIVSDPKTYMSQKLFDSYKEKMVRKMRCELFDAVALAYSNAGRMYFYQSLPAQARLEALEALSFEDVCAFSKTMLEQVFVRGLFMGNLVADEVQSYSGRIKQLFHLGQLPSSLFPEWRCIKVPENRWWTVKQPVQNPKESNSALVLSFQVGERQTVDADLAKMTLQFVEPMTSLMHRLYGILSGKSTMDASSFVSWVKGGPSAFRDPEFNVQPLPVTNATLCNLVESVGAVLLFLSFILILIDEVLCR